MYKSDTFRPALFSYRRNLPSYICQILQRNSDPVFRSLKPSVPVIENVGYQSGSRETLPIQMNSFHPSDFSKRYRTTREHKVRGITRPFFPFQPLLYAGFLFPASREKSAKRFVSLVAGRFLKGFINFRIKRAPPAFSNFPIVGERPLSFRCVHARKRRRRRHCCPPRLPQVTDNLLSFYDHFLRTATVDARG